MFSIRRRIEIDMGHRVPTHVGQCASLHGHRYAIWAEVSSRVLHAEGTQTDMTMDFGFIKHVMMSYIHNTCDHAMCLYAWDPKVDILLGALRGKPYDLDVIREDLQAGRVADHRLLPRIVELDSDKMVLVKFIPTAERLAEWWYNLMKDEIETNLEGIGTFESVEVWETPNCPAVYIPTATEI